MQPEVKILIDPLEELGVLPPFANTDADGNEVEVVIEVEVVGYDNTEDDVGAVPEEVLDDEDVEEEAGLDAIVEIVEVVEVIDVVVGEEGFEEREAVEVKDGFEEAVVVEEADDFTVLVELDGLDCLAVHDLVPVSRTYPSLHIHPR